MKKVNFLLTTIILLGSCHKQDHESATPADAPVVYVAGSVEVDHIHNYRKAVLWKNGVATYLTDGGHNAGALTVAKDGDDIYVAGYDDNKAKYWKNNVSVDLPGSSNMIAHDIRVNAGDIYVTCSSDQVIKSWHNGVATNMPAPAHYASCFYDRIITYRNDLYSTISDSRMVGYWKNGAATYVTDGENLKNAKSLAVSGNDIYIAGYEYFDTTNVFLSKKVATYWKNGEAVRLAGHDVASEVVVIAVNQRGVHAAGYETSSGGTVAKWWENGEAITLDNGNTTIEKILVSGNDVYIAGVESSGSPASRLKYWKNGVVTYLTDGTSQVYFSDMTVKDNTVYILGYEDGAVKYWQNGVATVLESDGQYPNAFKILVQ